MASPADGDGLAGPLPGPPAPALLIASLGRGRRSGDDRLSPGTREGAGAFGWTGRRAEWIALACLHGGVLTRAQWTRFLGCHTEKVRRAVHTLIASGVAAEENVPGIKGIGRVCRIVGRRLYRALGAEDIRSRRAASEAVLMRRLLSLDYVLEHPGLPWLPTEPENVGSFKALGIERRLLPSRLYRGAAGSTQ